jgi:hypothetical protein
MTLLAIINLLVGLVALGLAVGWLWVARKVASDASR